MPNDILFPSRGTRNIKLKEYTKRSSSIKIGSLKYAIRAFQIPKQNETVNSSPVRP